MTSQEKEDLQEFINESKHPEYLLELIEKYSIEKYFENN
jgi:hypothetical protein